MSYEKQETSEQRLRPDLRFSPVRPSGLGEIAIGESGVFDYGGRVHWRKATATGDAADGSTTYSYHGEIAFADRSRSTKFTASEKVDRNKKLLRSWVTYNTPVEQGFQCPEIGTVTIKDIVKIHSEYGDWSKGYFTTVTTLTGQCHKFMTSPDGVVSWYEHAYSFQGAPVDPVRRSALGEQKTGKAGLMVGHSVNVTRNGLDRSAIHSYLGEIEHAGPFSQTVRNLWQAKKSIRARA